MRVDWVRALKLSEIAFQEMVEGRIEWGHPLRALTIMQNLGRPDDGDLPGPTEEWVEWMKAHVPDMQVCWQNWTDVHLVD